MPHCLSPTAGADDIFNFLRQPQEDIKDTHEAVRKFQTYCPRAIEHAFIWFPGVDIHDTLPALHRLPAEPGTFVGYSVHANGFAVLFTALPDSDNDATTHVSMALLAVTIPNEDVMDSSSLTVNYPSYDITWRVALERLTPDTVGLPS